MSLSITIQWLSNNFWLRSNVDFGQMMRQKYVLVTFQKNIMWKIHSYNFCGVWRNSNVTSSVTKYCCQKVISNNITFERSN